VILEFGVKPTAKVVGKKIKELDFPKNAVVGGVIRYGLGFATMGDFEFKPDDRVVVLTKPECLSKVEAFFA